MEQEIDQIKAEINNIKERLRAIEKEQRLIREDILSGEPQLHMKRRILGNPVESNEVRKKRYDNIDIKI